MTIYLIRKKKGRIYRSEAIVPLLLEQDALQGLTFRHGISGVPELVIHADTLSEMPAPCRISISDTKNYWCAVLGEGSGLGIDLEEADRRITPQLVKRLHPLEQEYLSGLEAGGREWTEEFLSIWTRKEAYSKFCEAGISIGFGKFSTLNENLEYRSVIHCQNRPDALVQMVSLSRALFCALCTEKPEIPRVVLMEYNGLPAVPPQTAAADLLALRSLSSAELKKKLTAKGYTQEEILQTVDEMAAKGYTDDEAYALRQAALAARKGKSRQLIRRDLAAKGLEDRDIAAAMEQLDTDAEGETEFDRAMAAAEKIVSLPGRDEAGKEARKRDVPEEKTLGKIGRKLSSLGYSAGIIYQVLDRYRKQ